MIDEISVVSSDLWTKIDAQLTKVFWSNTFSFPSVSMMLVGDVIPFPTVKGRLHFSKFTNGSGMKQFLS